MRSMSILEEMVEMNAMLHVCEIGLQDILIPMTSGFFPLLSQCPTFL
jgi:hypothetical protein